MEENNGMLEKFFHLSQNHTNVKTEMIAGFTTFMTMAYILALNPSVLGAAGMDKAAVLTATAIASMLGTLLMALLANYPFALAPGVGLTVYFAFTVVLQMGYSWQMALAAVFTEGIIFIILSLTSIREAIFNAIPLTLKSSVSVGIGMFIAFIGLQNAGVIVGNPSTKVALFSFKAALAKGTFFTLGTPVVLALIGIIVTAILMNKKVKGDILWGILFTWIAGMICEMTGLYIPDPKVGAFSTFPNLSQGFMPAGLGPIMGHLDFSKFFSFDFLVVIFAFLFVDLFDTLGTLIGVATKADMLDENGKLPRIKGALMADSLATCAGAFLGTSTTTTFVESASGVAAGGRTGLASVFTAILFGLSAFLAPFFLAIPAFATTPALVMVGFLMFSAAVNIDFNDLTEAVPAYLSIIAMPFCYSIADGISSGVISYVVVNIICGKTNKISPLMYILAILFICKYVLL